jgi:hypothetical protein
MVEVAGRPRITGPIMGMGVVVSLHQRSQGTELIGGKWPKTLCLHDTADIVFHGRKEGGMITSLAMTSWAQALADLGARAPWADGDIPLRLSTATAITMVNAVLEGSKIRALVASTIDQLWVKFPTPDHPVAFVAMRLVRGTSALIDDPYKVLVPTSEMSDQAHGLALYEVPRPSAAATVAANDYLVEYLGEATEREVKEAFGRALVYLVRGKQNVV